MNNESARRLMIKERERREALRKAQEAKETEKEILEDIPEKEAEDTEDVITDRENGDNEQNKGIE